jgi:threonyl-tRNA synthetase
MSEINVQLGEGRSAQVPSGATVADAIKQLDRDAAKQALAAKVNGREFDLSAKLEDVARRAGVKRTATRRRTAHSSIEPVLPGTLDGLDVIRHSTAHLLAAAVLDLFPGTKLGVGPALLEDPRYGFFYDVIAPRTLTDEDLPVIEKRMRDSPSATSRTAARRFQRGSAAHLRGARRAAEVRADRRQGRREVSVYYIDGSPFIDFCLGPHVPNTNKLKAFKLLSLSGAYWMGDAERPQMQRIYGTAFFTQEELDAWVKQREEAEKRDHRRWVKSLTSSRFRTQYGQGLVFWHPKGASFARRWRTTSTRS